MDITDYINFQTDIDTDKLADVEQRIRLLLREQWPDLSTTPSSVFGNLFITPAARVIAMFEQASDCVLSDLNLENALNSIVCDCTFIENFLKGLGLNSLYDVNTTSMVRMTINGFGPQNDQASISFDQGYSLLFGEQYIFHFIPSSSSSIVIQRPGDGVFSDHLNNIYTASVNGINYNNESTVANSWFVDIPVYGPSTANIASLSEASVDENFPILDNVVSIQILEDITPLELPTTIQELAEFCLRVWPSANLTTKYGAISYIYHKYPKTLGASVVTTSDFPEMKRNVDSNFQVQLPYVDIYIKNAPTPLQCTEFIQANTPVTSESSSGTTTYKSYVMNLQHIPLMFRSITPLTSGGNVTGDPIATVNTSTTANQYVYCPQFFSTSDPAIAAATNIAILANNDATQYYTATVTEDNNIPTITLSELENPPEGLYQNNIIKTSTNQYYRITVSYTEDPETGASIPVPNLSPVSDTPEALYNSNLTYQLTGLPENTNTNSGGWFAITYDYDPLAEAVAKTVQGPSCAPALNMLVRPFFVCYVNSINITYRKNSGMFFDRQAVIDELYTFINSMTYPITYDSAYISDILITNGASSLVSITASTTFMTTPALNSASSNMYYNSDTLEYPSNDTPIVSSYGLGPKNIGYICDRANINLIEKIS